jgi:hypothetical protein
LIAEVVSNSLQRSKRLTKDFILIIQKQNLERKMLLIALQLKETLNDRCRTERSPILSLLDLRSAPTCLSTWVMTKNHLYPADEAITTFSG